MNISSHLLQQLSLKIKIKILSYFWKRIYDCKNVQNIEEKEIIFIILEGEEENIDNKLPIKLKKPI